MPGEPIPDRRDLRASHEDRDRAVEHLRDAAGDGRLTPEELDERLEIALTARTYGELEQVVADLPSTPVPAPVADHVLAKESVELRAMHGNIRRVGPWPVPGHIDVEARSGNVMIDFTEAVITRPTLDMTVTLRSGNLTLVVPRDVYVDVDGVSLRSGNVRQRVQVDPRTQPRLVITVTGNLRSGNLTVRGPREGLWAKMRRQPPTDQAY